MALSTRMKVKLGTKVKLVLSGEQGEVIGRAEYLDQVPQYYVRYVGGDGRQVEAWLGADAFIEAEG